MKTGALLVAAAALAGCATTPSPQLNSPQLHSNDTAANSPRVDRCMWAKPRCRAK